MNSWDPSVGFLSFRDTTQAIYILLHCIRATTSGQSHLSPAQTDAMLAWGRQHLSRLHIWLRDLSWAGLHKGCLATPGDAAAILSFPHIASHHLIINIIDPLIALGSTPDGRGLISEELISAIQSTWSSACLAYPDQLASGAAFLWCSGLDMIDTRLMELRAIHG